MTLQTGGVHREGPRRPEVEGQVTAGPTARNTMTEEPLTVSTWKA